MKNGDARTPLSIHIRRLCAAIGACFLAALTLRVLRLAAAEKWALGAGCLLSAALLVLLLILWLREKSSGGDNGDAQTDKRRMSP